MRGALPLHLWLFVGLSLYYAVIGGDINRDRFLLLLFATGVVAALVLARRAAPSVGPPLVAAVIAGHALIAGALWDRRLDYRAEFPKHDQGVALGRHLGERYPGTLLASTGAGKLPFYSRLETIDMLGLNDRHIAMSPARGSVPGHTKWDTPYVLARGPDLICGAITPDGVMPFFGGPELYRKEGYAPALLVRQRGAPGEAILPADAMTEAEFGDAVRAGYSLGCLSRGS